METKDLFEKCFGVEPETGYIFKHIQISLGWRAICINWLAQGIGFGEVAIYVEDKKIKIDTEGMGKDFCDALIAESVKILKMEEEKNPPTPEELERGWLRQTINSNFLKNMYDNVTWEE